MVQNIELKFNLGTILADRLPANVPKTQCERRLHQVSQASQLTLCCIINQNKELCHVKTNNFHVKLFAVTTVASLQTACKLEFRTRSAANDNSSLKIWIPSRIITCYQATNRFREYDCVFKLVLIGDKQVGKSSIMMRYTEDKFETTKIDVTQVLSFRDLECGFYINLGFCNCTTKRFPQYRGPQLS